MQSIECATDSHRRIGTSFDRGLSAKRAIDVQFIAGTTQANIDLLDGTQDGFGSSPVDKPLGVVDGSRQFGGQARDARQCLGVSIFQQQSIDHRIPLRELRQQL